MCRGAWTQRGTCCWCLHGLVALIWQHCCMAFSRLRLLSRLPLLTLHQRYSPWQLVYGMFVANHLHNSW